MPVSQLAALGAAEPGHRTERTYLRFTVNDRPGVLAEITAAMRDGDVSIESLIQQGRANEGGEVLVATPEAQVLEGSTDATWSVVVRFPDMDALNGWYSSEEYQAVAPKRRELTDGNQSFLIAAPQFEGLPG